MKKSVSRDKTTKSKDQLVESRVISIDVFRALVVLLMVFANEITFSGVRNVPDWLHHATASAKMITFVDVILPAFLFILGMAIPLSVERRIHSGESPRKIWLHILIRTICLMVMGICMGNGFRPDITLKPVAISDDLWRVLLILSFVLIWNKYQPSDDRQKNVFRALHVGGIVLLIFLVAVYRQESDAGLNWLRYRWQSTLNLIAWAYIVSCTVYAVFRKQPAGVVGSVVLLILLYIGARTGALFSEIPLLNNIGDWRFPVSLLIGIFPSMAVAGIFVSMLFIQGIPREEHRKKIKGILVCAMTMFVAAYLLRRTYGISQVRATPSWCLFSSAVCCAVYAFIYWLVDVRKTRRWYLFILPLGLNPLLPFLLGFVITPLFRVLRLNLIMDRFDAGTEGIIRSIVVAFILILFSRWLIIRGRVSIRL